ncbi:MAG: DegV family protein, partial [Clostridia bacterium]|nr:DegV family protein [Clostridia bacterium]
MNTYFITTDSTADFPKEFYESDFDIVKMSFVLDGKLYDGYENEFLPSKEFYAAIANGKTATTSMPSVGLIEDFFENICSKGYDILHIS